MIEYIILGIVQGIAEWLPVSSEGMISLIMVNMFGMSLKEAATYAIWLHLGTLISATIYFRKDIVVIATDRKVHNKSVFWFLGIATVCSLIVAGPIYLFGLEHINLSFATIFIGVMLLISGFLQLIAKEKDKPKEVNINDSFLVGLLQGLAVFPGISRSGMTTSTLLLKKYDKEMALKLSFLLSIPLVAASSLYLLISESIVFNLGNTIALVTSAVVGYFSIKLLLKFARKINFGVFCLIMGALSILSIFL